MSKLGPKSTAEFERKLREALPVAVDAALEAGAFIKSKFGKFRRLTEKPDTSLVTEVDKRSEQLVLRALRKPFPHDHVMAEETGSSEGRGNALARWHIDPLDGTTNFVHGFPMFCVSIGMEYADLGPVLGVIYHPLTGDLYTAARGKGAFKNKKPIHVSKTAKLRHALLSTGFSTRRQGPTDREMTVFARVTSASHAVRRTGSAALDLTFTATGQFDGFWERGLNSWDVAAASVLVTEAGGRVTRMDGKNFRFGDETIVATNGRIHDELLKTF